MTEDQIHALFGLRFVNQIVKLPSGNEISRHFDATNGSLSLFLNDWREIDEIDKDLLPVINSLLTKTTLEDTLDSATEWVELNHTLTKFWHRGNLYDIDDPDFAIPTEHFKIIIMMWRQFLITAPSDGTNVK